LFAKNFHDFIIVAMSTPDNREFLRYTARMRNSLPSEIGQQFEGKEVLVTGGAGFIGSHLTELLVQLGARVTVIDNFLTGSRKNLDGITCQLIEADVSQPAENYLPAGYVPDFVFHFASPASPPKYQAHPVETYAVNSFGTHHLLQFLKSHAPAARFLFASTSEVYGDPEQHPQNENYWGNVNPNGIRSCYDEAKRLGETICGVHQRDFKMDVRIIRIFNTYGPRMDLEDGRVIPDFIQQGLSGQPFRIFGDGTQTRSYCFVSDLVDGIVRMMASPAANGETVNLGNPEEFTINQTLDVFKTALQSFVSQVPDAAHFPLPKDDPKRRRPDITKAQQLLGWKPTVAFADGLRETIQFYASAK
jgi:nucleoside-diphosphate-sugar epimerase